MLKIFERIKNEIIYRWEDTVTTDLVVEFIELNEHSVIIPAPQKGILKGATERIINSFLENKVSSWYRKSFQDGIGTLSPENGSSTIRNKRQCSTYYNENIYIVLSPYMLRYTTPETIISELDREICRGFFKVIYNVDGTCNLVIRPLCKRSGSADKLHFIFLYDKKTEKKARRLNAVITQAYEKE